MGVAAMLSGVVLESDGYRLLGRFYQADGPGPHPTLVMAHGIAGVELNLDLADVLRDAGWNVLAFHYRGCWGSEGLYRIATLVEDVQAAIGWAMAQPSVDRHRVVLLGYSIGGWAAVLAAVQDPRVYALITLSAVSDLRAWTPDEAMLADWVRFMNGMSVEALREELRAQAGMAQPVDVVDQLSPRPILIVHGTADPVVPHRHSLALHHRAGLNTDLALIDGGDHRYTGRRRVMIQRIQRWLEQICRS
ncbi:MAG TPA: alpha/beta fold hydrolase [Thermoflexus sp.]|nr:alpha/beta fold hydrolase [Thermoflexus sp.]